MKTLFSMALLLGSFGFAHAQDAAVCAPDSGSCQTPPVIYTVPVVYRASVVYNAPVVYYAPVYYSAPPTPGEACYGYAPPPRSTGSTVVHITGRGTYSYTRYRGSCGSTVIHIGSRY